MKQTIFLILFSAAALVQAGDPCCEIASIDKRTGTVTARARQSQGGEIETLSFKVTDPQLLKSLKVGQAVYADLETKRVSIKPGGPCCEITGTTPRAKRKEPRAERKQP